jgi:hypothetical protein
MEPYDLTDPYYPSVDQLARHKRSRDLILLALTTLVMAGAAAVMVALQLRAPAMSPAVLLLIGGLLVVCLAVPIVIWNEPRVGLYLMVTGALLCGGMPGTGISTMPTSLIPFWWNLSTVGQFYGHTGAFNALVFSPAEAIIVLTFVSWLVRSVVRRDVAFVRGAFFWPILAYSTMVAVGFAHGLSGGGNVTMALYEVRAQAHFLVAYLLAVNLITEKRHVVTLLWILVACLGIEGLAGTANYLTHAGQVTSEGTPIHDDSLLFNLLFFLLIILAVTRTYPRMALVALLATPCALIAVLDNQRRAGIACFAVAFLPLIPILWRYFAERRTQIAAFGAAFALLTALYLPLAWNASGAWALPARAIRSQSSPDARDASSDIYRANEEIDLKFTRDTAPLIGIGYGKPFYQEVPLIALTTNFLDYLPHNSVLWIWMRLGHVGFFLFLLMYAVVLIRGTQIGAELRTPILKVFTILALLNMLMIFIYGKYDLQFTNLREMFFAAVLVGTVGVMDRIEAREP